MLLTEQQIRMMTNPALRKKVRECNSIFDMSICSRSIDLMDTATMVRFLKEFYCENNPNHSFMGILPDEYDRKEQALSLYPKLKVLHPKEKKEKKKYKYKNKNRYKLGDNGVRGRLVHCVPLNKTYGGLTNNETKIEIMEDMSLLTGDIVKSKHLAVNIIRLLLDGSCASHMQENAQAYIDKNFPKDRDLYYKRVGESLKAKAKAEVVARKNKYNGSVDPNLNKKINKRKR